MKSIAPMQMETQMWQLMYFATSWKKFQMLYFGKASVIRVADGKVMWKSGCTVKQNNKKTASSIDDLKSNTNGILAEWTESIGPECSKQLLKIF